MLEDGALVAVEAAAEPLAEVTAEPAALARLAWHVGNRHTPAEIGDGRLLIQRDHVIEDMLAKLGAAVRHVRAPFRPEGGAYGHGRTHGHHHGGADRRSGRPRARTATEVAEARSATADPRRLVLARLSGRRLQLSARARMGGRGRDRSATGRRSPPGWRRSRVRRGRIPTRCCWRRPGGRKIPAPSPSSPRRWRHRRSGSSRRWRRARPSRGSPRAVWGIEVPAVAYPVAVGVAARRLGLPLAPTATLFVQGFAANLVSAGVRLVPLGQTEGQRILAGAACRSRPGGGGGAGGAGGRGRRDRARRRPRGDAARDAVHAALPLVKPGGGYRSVVSSRAIRSSWSCDTPARSVRICVTPSMRRFSFANPSRTSLRKGPQPRPAGRSTGCASPAGDGSCGSPARRPSGPPRTAYLA